LGLKIAGTRGRSELRPSRRERLSLLCVARGDDHSWSQARPYSSANRYHCQEGPRRAIVFKASYGRWQMADGRWFPIGAHSQLATPDRQKVNRPASGKPRRGARRRPNRCLSLDRVARTSGRSPAHHLVQHPVKSEFELFRCFVTSGCDLATNLLHFLVADLRQLADAVEHLSQGRDLDMIARGARMYSLTGIHAECGQSRVNGLRALCSPCTENFHWASQNGALTDGSTHGSSGCCSIDNP